jgi:hypothetical protein
MPMYRRKPIALEARQLTPGNMEEIAAWSGGVIIGHAPPLLLIPTLEGPVRADTVRATLGSGGDGTGDWVIQGVKGEFWPVRHDIFQETYEPAETAEGTTG